MSKVKEGQTVEVHYVGTFDDGTEFDNSRERGEAITFEVGSGQMIKGFDDAIVGMEVGDSKNISLEPHEAYGDTNPDAIQTYPLTAFPPDVTLEEGITIMGQSPEGHQVIAKIESLNEDSAVLDFNHPMAGKRLNFEVELISVG